MGLPGAGKTTLARALVKKLGMREVDRDRIRAEMFPSCDFTIEEKRAANVALLEAVEANCRLGHASIVDGMTFSRRAEIDALERRVVAAGFRLLPLFLDLSAETAADRVRRDPGHTARDRDPKLVYEVAERFEPVPRDTVRIDASAAPEQIVAVALAAIEAASGP